MRTRTRTIVEWALPLVAGIVVGLHLGSLDTADRADVRNSDIMRLVDGDYASGSLTNDEVESLLPVYGVAESTGEPCYMVTADLVATHDYKGYMHACLGDEDSPAVRVILGG